MVIDVRYTLYQLDAICISSSSIIITAIRITWSISTTIIHSTTTIPQITRTAAIAQPRGYQEPHIRPRQLLLPVLFDICIVLVKNIAYRHGRCQWPVWIQPRIFRGFGGQVASMGMEWTHLELLGVYVSKRSDYIRRLGYALAGQWTQQQYECGITAKSDQWACDCESSDGH